MLFNLSDIPIRGIFRKVRPFSGLSSIFIFMEIMRVPEFRILHHENVRVVNHNEKLVCREVVFPIPNVGVSGDSSAIGGQSTNRTLKGTSVQYIASFEV